MRHTQKKYITHEDKQYNTHAAHSYNIVIFTCDTFFLYMSFGKFPVIFCVHLEPVWQSLKFGLVFDLLSTYTYKNSAFSDVGS